MHYFVKCFGTFLYTHTNSHGIIYSGKAVHRCFYGIFCHLGQVSVQVSHVPPHQTFIHVLMDVSLCTGFIHLERCPNIFGNTVCAQSCVCMHVLMQRCMFLFAGRCIHSFVTHVLLSCTKTGPIKQINLRDWMKV